MRATSNFPYALRTLKKSPGFTLAVVLSLALGIGANAAIFSVINGLLFHPAGVVKPDELVAPRVSYKKLDLDKIGMSSTDFADVREDRQVFSKAALLDLEGLNYTGGDVPERLQSAFVTWQWFDVFGRSPALGRAFRAEEDQPGANHVAVLSFATWKRLFGGDRSALGRTIELNKTPYRIIGVMPGDFRWPAEADLWIPLGLPLKAYGPDNRFNEFYFAVARLAPGISYSRAETAMQAISRRVLDQYPYARGSQWSMVIEPLTEYSAGDLRTPMFILLGAVAFVLLIACSNIVGLMLVRATARSRELAVRTALGASRGDLMRQALAEVSLLALTGTALGFAAAFGLLRGLLSLAHSQLSTEIFVHIDAHVLAFAAATGLVCAALCGLIPAWRMQGLGEHYDQLKSGGRSDTEGRGRQRLRSALVAAQIALAMVLLAGAGLLLKTLGHLHSVNTGFDAHHLMTASVALPDTEYGSDEKQIAFYRGVLDKLSATPGISSAAAASSLPFSGIDPTASFDIEGRVLPPGDPGFHGSSRYASPGYFEALKIPLLNGRFFNGSDRKNSQPVAVIDVNLARRYWPNENPIGHRIRRGSKEPWSTIIGIAGHVKVSSLAADSGRGAYYFPLYQQPVSDAFFVVRGNVSSAQLGQAIRNAVAAFDAAQAVFDMKMMDQRIALALGPQQLASQLLIAFAGAALLLAIVGLYGVISYNVTRRTREIGIRTALGAGRSHIFSLVIRQALGLLGLGLIAGFVVSLMLGNFASSQLFGVSPADPATFAITGLILSAAALLATLIPAWRAARVQPVTALRTE